jgi:NADH-quinone oxidoreductase subunit N
MDEVTRSITLFLPEVILTIGILVVVLLDASLVKWRGAASHTVSVLTLLAALVVDVLRPTPAGEIWNGMLAVDPLATFFKGILLGAALVVAAAFTFRNARELRGLGQGEFYALLLAVTLGTLLLATANDLVMLYLALEMVSIGSYVLVAYMKGDRMSNEASLKYLLFGAASTGAMLYGLSLLFGLTGTTHIPEIQQVLAGGLPDANRLAIGAIFVLVLAGFGFKTALVPFHFWCPDAYEGAPTPVTAYLSVAPKAAGFAILVRFMYGGLATPISGAWDLTATIHWQPLLMIVSAVTMTLGNVAALTQTNMKRMLAYSSIAHAGYVLMGVVALSAEGARGVLAYLFAYLFMNLGAFLVVTLVQYHEGSFDLRDYPGLWRRSPLLTVTMSVFLLSLMGIPPLVGFVGKLYVFAAIIEQGSAFYWLAIVGAVNAAVAAYYYTRVLKTMIIDREEEGEQKPVLKLAALDQAWLVVLAVANLVTVLGWTYVDGWAQTAVHVASR